MNPLTLESTERGCYLVISVSVWKYGRMVAVETDIILTRRENNCATPSIDNNHSGLPRPTEIL